MDFLITADARKVSPSQFFQGCFPGLPSREERYAELKRIIARRIEQGSDLYGLPPGAVADVRAELAAKGAAA